MEILDAQVHTWLSDRPRRPWASTYRPMYMERQNMLLHAGQTMAPEQVVVEMAEAGVDGGVLSPLGVYGNDNSFELAAAERFPRKFTVVGWVDHLAEDLGERLATDIGRGMVGVRVLRLRDQAAIGRGDFDRLLGLCADLNVSVSFMLDHPVSPGLIGLIKRHKSVLFVIDHVGLGSAPPTLGPTPAEPFANLRTVLELSELVNVCLKLTGAPALSHEPYPFKDIWAPVREIVGAFGADRVMWGTDFTRVSGLHSYWDATHYLAEIDGLSGEQLELMYGQSLRTLLHWADRPHARPPLDPDLRLPGS